MCRYCKHTAKTRQRLAPGRCPRPPTRSSCAELAGRGRFHQLCPCSIAGQYLGKIDQRRTQSCAASPGMASEEPDAEEPEPEADTEVIEFEFPTTPRGQITQPSAKAGPPRSQGQRLALAASQGQAAPGGQLSDDSPWSDREALAREAGLWVRRVLDFGFEQAAIFHGRSPRARQTARNRVWVVFRDADGYDLYPAVVVRKYESCRFLVEVVEESRPVLSRRAVLMGWPSQREARECVTTAAFTWPEVILD